VTVRGGEGFRIVSANRAVLELSGKRNIHVGNLVGKTIAALFPSVCENDLAAGLLSVIRSGRPEVLGEIHFGSARALTQVLTIYAFPLADFCAGIALESTPKRKLAQRKLRGH
jgi:hypothetical protein